MTGKEARQRLDVLIQEIELKKAELDTLLSSAQQTKTQLDTVNTDANNKLISISSIESQSNQKHESINQILVATQQKQTEINNEKQVAENSRTGIENLEKKAEELENKVETTQQRSETLGNRIETQLGIAVAGTLAHTFNDRKKELETSLKKWFWWLIADLSVLLFGVAIIVVWELSGSNGITYNLLLKLTISFPLIYAAYFFHSQYDEEKRLLEEYAFKSAVSLSLEAYRELLKQEVEPTQDKAKIVEFVTDSINRIYTSPRENISSHPDKENNIKVGMLKEVVDIIKSIIGR
ncbi:MAG: hypothetical protein ABSE68_02315 [Minisyncoccia bacterium]